MIADVRMMDIAAGAMIRLALAVGALTVVALPGRGYEFGASIQ